jgi:hypothetical protein
MRRRGGPWRSRTGGGRPRRIAAAAIDRTVTAAGARLLEAAVGAVRDFADIRAGWKPCGALCAICRRCATGCARRCGRCRTWTARCRGWRLTGAGRAIWRRSRAGLTQAAADCRDAGEHHVARTFWRGGGTLSGHDALVDLERAWWPSRRCCCAMGVHRPVLIPNWTRPEPARRGARCRSRGCRPTMPRKPEFIQPEDQAQQRAGLFHRNDGPPRRADAGPATVGTVHPPPDHGQPGAVYHG